jgi:hypothetical protein
MIGGVEPKGCSQQEEWRRRVTHTVVQVSDQLAGTIFDDKLLLRRCLY